MGKLPIVSWFWVRSLEIDKKRLKRQLKLIFIYLFSFGNQQVKKYYPDQNH